MPKRILVNNWIKARKVRVIDKDGKQLGVFDLTQALRQSREAGLDLIQVTDKVEPPVCKIMDYGKYVYQEKKKEKKQRHQQSSELKNIRLTFNISEHDLETRIKAAQKFLDKGHKVRLEMVLRGRQKSYNLTNFAKEKIGHFLEILKQTTPIKVERDLKRQARGLTMIITKV